MSKGQVTFNYDCYTSRVMGDKNSTSVETDFETLEDAINDTLETARAFFDIGHKSVWVGISQDVDGRTIELYQSVISDPGQIELAPVTQLQDTV